MDNSLVRALAGPDAASLNLGNNFWKRVFDDRNTQCGYFLEPFPTAREKSLALADVTGIESALVERTFHDNGREVIGHDVLSERRIAADVALGRRVEHFGVENADDKSQVEIAIGKVGHVLAAHVAQITFVAFGHVLAVSYRLLAIGRFSAVRLMAESRKPIAYNPSTSFIPYSPGFFPMSHSAASSAPCA